MAVTTGTKAPATTVAPKIPSTDGYTAQGYCPIPVTVDVTRGATPDKVSWEFNSPVGFTTQDNGTVLNQISGVTLYAGDAAVQSDTATIANEGDKKVTIGPITYAASEKGVCVWIADLTYWTTEGATVAGAVKGDGTGLTGIKKGADLSYAAFGATDAVTLGASLDAMKSEDVTKIKADRDLKPGDIVTVKVQRKARITGAVYPTAIDEDWTVGDTYAPALNVNVATTGGLGAGGRFGAVGAAIPGDGFDLKLAGTAATGDLTTAKIVPAESGPWGPDAFITVNSWGTGPTDTFVGSAKFTWDGKAWGSPTALKAGEKVYPGAITSVAEKAAPGLTGPVEVTLMGNTAQAGTGAPAPTGLAGLTLDELNDLGGIDTQACFNRGVPQPTGILGAGIVGPDKQWPEGYFTTVSAGPSGATGPTAAYWDGSHFVAGTGAPGYLADPYQKPVKL